MSRETTLHELLLKAAARFPKSVAFRQIIGARAADISYGDLPRLSCLAARALWDLGLRPGERLIIWAANSPDWCIACLGALRIGAIVVPVDARAPGADAEKIASECGARLILAGDRQALRLADRQDGPPLYGLASLVTPATPARMPQTARVSADATALIVYTSGTASAAKGVVLSHKNIVANALAAAGTFAVGRNDRLLSILPLSHMLEFTGGLVAPLYCGATIVYSNLRGGADLKRLLEFEKISVILGTPLVFEKLLAAIEASIDEMPRGRQIAIRLARKACSLNPALAPLLFADLHRMLGGRIKYWLSGGAHTPLKLIEDLAAFGIPLYTGYGLSEASPIVAVNNRQHNMPGTVGRPLPGVEVRLGEPDHCGRREILVRGPGVMTEYWQNKTATDLALEGGWLHTGDAGHIDADGFLTVEGRLKSVIVVSSGDNVYPEEIEEALSASPAIKEACVFGRAGASGEEICAVVVPAQAVPSPAEKDARLKSAIDLALRSLPPFKHPAEIQVWQCELPRTASGKVRRGEVAKLFAERIQGPESPGPADTAALDADGLKVCRVLAGVMDPRVLAAINPSGSHILSPDLSLSANLAVDSFARVELKSALEQAFAVELDEAAISDAITVEDLIVAVKHALSPGYSPASESSGLTRRSRPWPVDHCGEIEWPAGDDPGVVACRRTLGVAMKVFAMIYNRLTVYGKDRLMLDPPYIIAANHSSHLDLVALIASFPSGLLRLVHPVAAADYFFASRVKSALSTYALNAVPFDRFGDYEESLRRCERLLAKGRILIIFPEGTRSPDGAMAEFKPGAARLALSTGCPIIPARIEGTHEALPKGRFLPRPAEVRVTFGLPIYPHESGSGITACQKLTGRVREAIAGLGTAGRQAAPADSVG